ncbi:MAG: hypothetical protein C0502_10620 [Opitutus sp.]|nr:hypothetical protein [Opitutus sp.]
MKRVEVKLNLDAVAPLLDVIKSAADRLGPRLAVAPQVPEHDAEFAEAWKRELLAAQQSDVGMLLGLFGADFFASGVIGLDPTNSEAILRASAAIRLELRERHLKDLEDESLESGEIDVEALPEATQRAFAAYVFLATLQEVIVQHLDPTVME